MITIIVRAWEGHSRSTSKRFEAKLQQEQETLCVSEQPFLDSARKLIERGCDPHELLVMRYQDANTVCLSAPLAVAAKLTLDEGPHRGPRFKPWKGFRSGDVPARIAANDNPATPVAAGTEKTKLARAA